MKKTTLCAFLLLLAFVSCHKAPADRPQNIILISIDSLRADHVGCYGYKRPTTPHIDELARAGTIFHTTVSTTSWTLPAHMSMLTGLIPELHQVTRQSQLDPARPFLPDMLHRAGFLTAGFVSGPYLDQRYGFNRGFDVYRNFWKAAGIPGANAKTADSDETGDSVIAEAKNWLDSNKKKKFFLFVHLWDVHYDYVPPAPYNTRFVAPGYKGKVDMNGYYTNRTINANMPREDLDYVISQYDGEIAYADSLIGKLMSFVQSAELLQNTMVVITADHGDEFFEHGRKGHHQTLYDEVVLVPLIVLGAGVKANPKGITDQVSLIDVAPTILSTVNLPRDPEMMGENLAPLLAGNSLPHSNASTNLLRPSPYALLQLKFRFGIRTPEWKVIYYPDMSDSYEIFNLKSDPGEHTNIEPVEGQPSYDMKQRLNAFRTAVQKAAADLKRKGTRNVTLDETEKERLRALGYTDEE